jgi:response regulator NasT
MAAATQKPNDAGSAADQRVIERAKRLLMAYMGLTEPQAHRYIEKHAMDFRKRKIEIARGVLKIYEN